jgi:F-type H+-transporting ATPase subunit delta
MSAALTLARPYARAAFESARAAGTLDAWSSQLRFAAEVIAHPTVQAIRGNPRVSNRELVELLLPPGVAPDSPFAAFLTLLVENRRTHILGEIAALFEQLKREAGRVIRVTVRTPQPIPPNEETALRAALQRRFDRTIELEQRLDPTLLGGAVIDAGDVVIDGSVRGRLAKLASVLTQ